VTRPRAPIYSYYISLGLEAFPPNRHRDRSGTNARVWMQSVVFSFLTIVGSMESTTFPHGDLMRSGPGDYQLPGGATHDGDNFFGAITDCKVGGRTTIINPPPKGPHGLVDCLDLVISSSDGSDRVGSVATLYRLRCAL
jgi:hypothetical protein